MKPAKSIYQLYISFQIFERIAKMGWKKRKCSAGTGLEFRKKKVRGRTSGTDLDTMYLPKCACKGPVSSIRIMSPFLSQRGQMGRVPTCLLPMSDSIAREFDLQTSLFTVNGFFTTSCSSDFLHHLDRLRQFLTQVWAFQFQA